jgi:hypothetical protein
MCAEARLVVDVSGGACVEMAFSWLRVAVASFCFLVVCFSWIAMNQLLHAHRR